MSGSGSGCSSRRTKSCDAQRLSSRGNYPQMKFPLVLDLDLDLAANGIPVAVACRVLGFSRQAFYAWKAAPVTERDRSHAHLINAAVDVHRAIRHSGTCSSLTSSKARASAQERTRCRGCEQPADLVGVRQETRSDPKAGPPVHIDQVRRDFTAPALDQL